MAHVEKRGPGRWRARYRDPSGAEKSRTFPRRVDAEKFLTSVQHAKHAGTYTDDRLGRTTFAAWFDDYMARTPKRATTAARDRAVARRWLLPAFGATPLRAITPADVRRLVDAMAAKLEPSSVRTMYGVLRAVMTAAVEAEVIVRSPCRGVKLPADRREQPRFLSVDQLHALADAMPVEYRPMVYVAGVLGLRFSEVAGLRVGAVDFLRGTVSVLETVAEVEGRVMVADVKTKASRRLVTAPREVVEMLAEHLARRGRPGPDEFVFVAPMGGPLRANHFRKRVWAPAVKRAGLEGLTFHGLRHSAAGLMIELGAHPRVIQQRLGHASVRTTLDVYGAVLPTVDEHVSAGLGELLRSSRGLPAASDVSSS